MKKILILLAIILCANVAYSQPKMQVEGGDKYDWGKVSPKDSPLKKDLTIKNIGNERLVISEVKPTCGCTTAPLEKNDLKPGESTVVHITLNISSNSGPTTKYINFTTNEPENPHLQYTLKADVIRSIEISPTTFIQFKDLEVGLESVANIKIRNTTNKDIKLSGIEVYPPELRCNLKDNMVLKAGKTFDVIVKVRPNQKGNLSARIKALTNDPDFPELLIHGYGNIKESPLFNSK